jgi:hypothetical protein
VLGRHLLLHDVGLDVIRLVRLRLLLLRDFEVLRFLDFEIALRFGLLGLRKRLGQHALLIGLRLRDRRFARCHRALDGRVPLGFRGGHVRVALDARHVRLAHVGDVFVLVADLFNRERDDFKPILFMSSAQVPRMRSPTISGCFTISSTVSCPMMPRRCPSITSRIRPSRS